MAVVVWLTFWGPSVANINVGLIGLPANLVVLVVTWIAVGRRVQPSAQLEPVVSRSASG